MTNGNEGTSSNPPPTEESPRRAPQGRGNPPVMGVPGQSAFTPYIRSPHPPLLFGVPGQSAFIPYTRPPPQQPLFGVSGQSAFSPYTQQQPHSGSSMGPNGSDGVGLGGEVGFQGAQAVPVGGSGSGSAALRVGGSPTARKRVQESGASGGNQAVDVNHTRCSLCGRVFLTPKALFGHMRSHPDRGWKGARPPPTFRAEEEFADLRGVEEGGGAAEEEEEVQNNGLPDLNKSPPDSS